MSTILVIDDSIALTEMLRSYLSEEGFKVLTAVNGNEGIKVIEEHIPDLVITDIIMPEKSGVEVVMYLKQHHPSTRIIAMSSGGAISASDHLLNIKKLGADCILSKPFNRDEFLLAANSIMEITAV